jgi:hypothetical protein
MDLANADLRAKLAAAEKRILALEFIEPQLAQCESIKAELRTKLAAAEALLARRPHYSNWAKGDDAFCDEDDPAHEPDQCDAWGGACAK